MRVLFPPWEGQPLPLLWKEAPKASGPPQARGASYTGSVHDGRTWFNNLPEGHINASVINENAQDYLYRYQIVLEQL